MKRTLYTKIGIFAMAILCVRVNGAQVNPGEIAWENGRVRAVLGADGMWKSLVNRAAGRELIPAGGKVPFASAKFDETVNAGPKEFSVYVPTVPAPARTRTVPASSARREGDTLIIGFHSQPATHNSQPECDIAYRVAVEPDAILFTIDSVKGVRPREMEFVHLETPSRAHLGSRLGAAWDDELAIGLMGMNLQSIAAARKLGNNAVLTATTQDQPGPRLEGAAAALVAAPPAQYRVILGKLAAQSGNLPRNEAGGMASRELPAARGSYWFISFGEADVDRVIEACRQSGLRQVMMSSGAWCVSPGHYLFNTRNYPEGQASLKRAVARLHEAGILVGMHAFASKVSKTDPYVSPRPDRRFWADREAVLAGALGPGDKSIRTKTDLREWPGSPVASQRAWEGGVAKHQEVLIDDEIVQYGAIGPEGAWDTFLDCKRGAWKTAAAEHPAGEAMRHYGVDGCINGYIIDQETGLLGEVADRLAAIFNDCGFDMIYFDGGEDVDKRRFTYYVSNFQAEVMRRLTKRPIVHMGTIMTHPLWHSFTRSGTVDTYLNTVNGARISGKSLAQVPTVREHIDKSVAYMLSVGEDMVPGELGWFGIWPAGKGVEGLQLDEIEYLMAKSLAYDAPISLETSFSQMASHPLTPGVLEIVKVYEGVRMAGAMSGEERAKLREKGAEFALVRVGEAWSLVRMGAVKKMAQGLRYSVGERDGAAIAVLWGSEKNMKIGLPLAGKGAMLETMEGSKVETGEKDGKLIFELGPRRITIRAPGMGMKMLAEIIERAEAAN